MNLEEELAAVLHSHSSLSAFTRELHRGLREQERRIRTLRFALRPSFPTAGQRAMITEAVRLMVEHDTPPTHHGRSIGHHVSVHGATAWMSVGHGAPYGGSLKLWDFTPYEIDTILDCIEVEGFDITEWWEHDGGISAILAVPGRERPFR